MLTDLKLLSLSRPGIHIDAVAIKTSGSDYCTCRGRNVCCLCYSVCQSADDSLEACDSAEGFVFEEGPATSSVYCIHYYWCLQILVLQIRNSGYTCLFSQDFNQTGLCSCCSHCSIFIEK